MPVLVSIVIPTYNRLNLLKKTINSLLDQTFPQKDYEIIICDDNSQDDTEKVVHGIIQKTNHNIKYVKVESDLEGPAKVRNAGIINSSGSIIGFTDDDCVVSNNWIKSAVDTLRKNAEAVGVSGAVVTEGNCKSKYRIPRRVTVLSDEGSYVTSNIFYRKQVLVDIGCFDESMKYLEDIELGWRAEEKGQIIFNPNMLVKHKLFCMSFFQYLKKMNFIEYWVIMYSKHPEHRKKDKLFLGFINNTRIFYVIFTLLGIASYPIFRDLSYLFISIALCTYTYNYIIYDRNITKYGFRLLRFPISFTVDLFRLYYTAKGISKSKFIVFY
jgi:glycosyltransferase involved in cell wall biosynthesis